MAEGGSSRNCELQKNEIAELLKKTLKKGDTWYLIDSKWFKQWKKYVGYDSWDTGHVGEESAYPGPIDNSALFKEGSSNVLREHLIDELDYVLVPDGAWQKFVEWYGTMEGQVPLARKVIEHGMFVKHCKVEVYLMDLKLCPNNDLDNVVTKHFSRADTIDSIEKEMRQTFHISSDKDVRLWNRYLANTYEHLNKPDNTIQDVGLYPGQVIVIEEQNDDGTWPRQAKSTGTVTHSTTSNSSRATNGENNIADSGYGSTSSHSSFSSGYCGSNSTYNSYNDSYGVTVQPGVCGLSNLGNTCFMNSAIQCMSNVPPLTQHMLSDKWREDLNRDNPLGMQGKIATSYAELIKNMWSGRHSYTVPRAFKTAVSQFAPQFSGYQQHDAQELMAFLLDGLHEDLNRIKNKPYVELKDADGRPDAVVAKESWENYLKRNDSVIVDIFHGQLKSTLVCPECEKISVTFDPFCYLTLPLPYRKEKNIKVTLVPFDPNKIRRQYKLLVPSYGCVEDLCAALSKLTDIPVQEMVVADVYNHRLHKIFSEDETLRNIQDRDDIYIYEIPACSKADSDMVLVNVYLREKKDKSYTNYSQSCGQLFGYPLVIPVPKKNCTYDVLYNHVLDRLQRFVKAPDLNDGWWQSKAEVTSSNSEGTEVEMDEESYNDNSDTPDKKCSSSEEELSEEVRNSSKENNSEHRLFKFTIVNSYGNTEMDKLDDNNEPIKLHGRMYLAADWEPKAKQQFYLQEEAEKLERDPSVQRDTKKIVIQLTDCLNLFTNKERLGEQDPWYCPQCKEFQQATKKFDLWKLPEILVIHLKRFQYNRYRRDKLDVSVEYPVRGLDMQPWIINNEHGPAIYDLKGVVNHYGGMGGGHYTAYCQNKDTHLWYHFDDSSVTKISEDAVVTHSAYVLVYQRRDSTSQEGISNGNDNLDTEVMEVN